MAKAQRQFLPGAIVLLVLSALPVVLPLDAWIHTRQEGAWWVVADGVLMAAAFFVFDYVNDRRGLRELFRTSHLPPARRWFIRGLLLAFVATFAVVSVADMQAGVVWFPRTLAVRLGLCVGIVCLVTAGFLQGATLPDEGDAPGCKRGEQLQ